MLCKKVGIFPQKIYKHSSIYAVNVGTQNNPQKQKPRKSKLLSSIKGEENRIEFQTPVNWKLRKIKTAEIKECLYVVCSLGFWTWAKGQLISKCPFGFIVWTKIPTKLFLDFCPEIFWSFVWASWKLFGLPVGFLIYDITY